MRHVNFDLSLDFDNEADRDTSERFLLRGLTELAAHNLNYLRAHPETPKLYDSGVCYMLPEQLERRPSDSQLRKLRKFLASTMGMGPAEIAHHVDLAQGVEIFRDISRIRENGGGDCDNLAAWCSAERALAGIDARPYMTHRMQGGRTIYHALVLWPDGSSEDPSIILGMGGKDKVAERREECRKNVERYENYWDQAKDAVGNAGGGAESLAVELKDRIDAIGLLPRDGVFRVPECRRPA
jgi:hypothetical protein